jgi:hypothetical protein
MRNWLDSQLRSPADQLRFGTDPELLVDADQVALHSALADKEVAGNLGCLQALRGEHRYLVLTPAQRIHADAGAAPGPALVARHEDLDRINDRVDVAEPWPVIRSW